MTHEPMERHPEVGNALKALDVDGFRHVDWAALRHGINARAAVELKRRRRQGLRRSVLVSGTLAAGIVLLVLASQRQEPSVSPAPVPSVRVQSQLTIDDLLDSNLSDDEFRVLLSGANDANDLLLIAAEDQRP